MENMEIIAGRHVLQLEILTTLSSWASPGHMLWPELDALSESCSGSPRFMALLLLCFGVFTAPCSLENPSAFSRTYQSDGGGNIQNAGNILCHSVSPAPRYWRPFVCSQREEETDKGQELGGGRQPAPLCPGLSSPMTMSPAS